MWNLTMNIVFFIKLVQIIVQNQTLINFTKGWVLDFFYKLNLIMYYEEYIQKLMNNQQPRLH